ncbi:MAG: FHA domain-containing protein [Chloroflexia bacterium]
MKRYTQIRSQVRRHAANFSTRPDITKVILAAVALLLTVMSVATFGLASAALPTGLVLQAEATATIAGSATAPSPVVSSRVPAAQNTAAPNPPPEETLQSQIVTASASGPTATTDTSILPSDAAPPGTDNSSPGSTTPTSAADSSSFPWLPVILLGAVLLGGLLYLMSRRRTADAVTVTSHTSTATTVAPYEPSGDSIATSPVSTTTTSATSTPMAEPVASPMVASAVVAPAPFVPPLAMPSTLDCPNCGTTNGINENFCHDCGMDLRRTRTALLDTIAPPPDLVTETTPYLETVSRVDEQLEYVLARPRVIIGAAAGSDIVIDSLFEGWQTVDPAHAELRRESEGFVLVDLGSGSGTFVNEMRTGENMLSDGDVIRVGEVRFVFRVPA